MRLDEPRRGSDSDASLSVCALKYTANPPEALCAGFLQGLEFLQLCWGLTDKEATQFALQNEHTPRLTSGDEKSPISFRFSSIPNTPAKSPWVKSIHLCGRVTQNSTKCFRVSEKVWISLLNVLKRYPGQVLIIYADARDILGVLVSALRPTLVTTFPGQL